MQALQQNTSSLPPVQILKPSSTLGKSTIPCIQSGLYYGQVGAMKTIIQNIAQEVFASKKPLVVATGGFANLFESEGLFDVVEPDLVLHGIRLALEMNLEKKNAG